LIDGYLTAVQDWALYLIAGLSPFVLQVVINLVTIRSWWDFHNSSLGRTSAAWFHDSNEPLHSLTEPGSEWLDHSICEDHGGSSSTR
jgi:hypothetical protein